MHKKPDTTIQFKDDFALIILRFILYFSISMFFIGCAMMFFSIEKNRVLPAIFLCFGFLILLFLIVEKNMFMGGYTEFDLSRFIIRKRYFFLRRHIFDLRTVESFIVQCVVSRQKAIIYNIFATIQGKRIPLGQERNMADLKTKLDTITKLIDCKVIEENQFIEAVSFPPIYKLVLVLLPLVIIFFFVAVGKPAGSTQKIKFLIVIFIPMSYFIFHYFTKINRNK